MRVTGVEGNGYNYIDQYGLLVINKPDYGIGDCVGRTAIGALVYDEDRATLLNGLNQCILYGSDYVTLLRHPESNLFNSRDHYILATACGCILNADIGYELATAAYIHDRVNVKPKLTKVQKLWLKYMVTGRGLNRFSFRLKFELLLYRLINNTLIPIGSKFGALRPIICKALFPTYAAFYTAFMVRAIGNDKVKNRLFKYLLPLFEESNYVARALCGVNDITAEVIANYVPTRVNRWSTRLDWVNDRDLSTYPQDKVPGLNLEYDLLLYLKNN